MSEHTTTEPRVRVEILFDETDRRAALHDATFWSLRATPKEIPAVWLYDERGSILFDEITRLPEYYPTRTEQAILIERAAEIAARTQARVLAELGAGTSEKTRLLLDALQTNGTLERFVPLDVSEEVLLTSAHAIADRYASVRVHAIVGDFERHLAALPADGERLVAFLGGTIGNLDRPRRATLFRALAAALADGGSFLLGVDLVKDPMRIEAAYNDRAGLTEAFIRNGLHAVNRQLGANFDDEKLRYDARWDPTNEWMEIGFVAREAHSVAIPELESAIALAAGERLRVEISAKFRRQGLTAELEQAGLSVDAWWTDPSADFALVLATPAAR